MLRCLTAIPPAKVRFTILDPVGLGENFAAFTHLADYLEALVTSRIWTEAGHIEQRLSDVTAHIENVIQQFLRNQFQTLEEYNAQAAEVAEPYRIIVVANFPVNFTPEAARRLVSIAASGARCGTHTLISVDTAQPMPQGFQLADLEQGATTLVWQDGRFTWGDKDYDRFPLELERPADDAFATKIMHVVGDEARRASRVEVPFDLIAPAPEEYWTGDSRSGLRVPLGRAGALKKQQLQLGQGTSQHVLIAGKTGSGKSTLLHALITQLALQYSPDEVELYLVDFKKGVEFKTYATHELPHARVVAIESEREFGLSVLQRLDGELKIRGERYRALGVNDLASARQAAPEAHLPRVLLIVDEFQEFFVEDDKVAQEAALLMDRLVRQGRAFGVHILLGSQTLGGAYSLTRTTIDQMAVRIALQCSEADGHLILSKENGAARLLARPGEAIYNDANGRVEGNELFQTVWLSDERREEALNAVRALARQRNHAPARPQIVFEGTAPADMARNPLLTQLLREPAWPASPGAVHAWLGEAVAIKDPTAAVFRRQGGANLLLVGQHGEAAANLMAASLVSLAAHQPLVEGLRCQLLGAGATDAPAEKELARLPDRFPHLVQPITARELPGVLTELAAEVDRRHKEGDTSAAPRFLFVYGIQRFRDLRKAEDDFSFSRRGEDKPNPAKLFATLLREGPPVGVFTVIWCDTMNNLNRAVDRQGLREFEMRILFQMSAADSSNLIDSPAASKLGLHRALFYTEDQGRLEKFRPYGMPEEGWLEALRQRLEAERAEAAR
jgi:DNA segregation ATPase FtsK/SpoIIIE, S-DNA-T family